jgi:Family of unknown function (DUF6090)
VQEEISKHAKKAYREMKSNHSFSEKLKEIAIEIGIIVFAVSLSIWLHGWSEHRHQQAEVKEFLADLKEDLKTDLIPLNDVKTRIKERKKDIEFLKSLNLFKMDSLKKANANIVFNASVNIAKFNVGNYEGFKSSGKIGYIENKKLKKLMLSYYQDTAPTIAEFDNLNKGLVLKLFEFIDENADKDNKEIFLDKRFKSKLNFYLSYSKGYIDAYEQTIKQVNELIIEIDKSK